MESVISAEVSPNESVPGELPFTDLITKHKNGNMRSNMDDIYDDEFQEYGEDSEEEEDLDAILWSLEHGSSETVTTGYA